MLAFVHIPKTAGTTARQLLQQRFGEQRLALVYDRPPGRPLTEITELPSEAWSRYQAVMGHFAFGIHHFIPQPVRYVTFLRDPVERVVSLYYHNVHRPSRCHERIHTEGIDLTQFVRARISCQVENSMTQFLAGIEHVAGRDRAVFSNGCPERLLEVAKRNLVEWFDLVGFVERPEESLALLATTLGLHSGAVEGLNVNRQRPAMDQIPAHALQEIRAANRLDAELYRFARERFEAQWQRLNGHLECHLGCPPAH